jgi:hypothetical protein
MEDSWSGFQRLAEGCDDWFEFPIDSIEIIVKLLMS